MFLAKELKVEHELVLIDLQKGEQKSESFTKINPNQVVPVLVDGDFVLCESFAILGYLASTYGNGKYLPKDNKHRAIVEQWQHWHHSHTSKGPIQLFVHKVVMKIFFKKEVDEKAVEEANKWTKDCFDKLDHQLSKTKFVCGDEISTFDVEEFQYFHNGLSFGVLDLSSHKHLHNWYTTISKMETVKETNKVFDGMVQQMTQKKE